MNNLSIKLFRFLINNFFKQLCNDDDEFGLGSSKSLLLLNAYRYVIVFFPAIYMAILFSARNPYRCIDVSDFDII